MSANEAAIKPVEAPAASVVRIRLSIYLPTASAACLTMIWIVCATKHVPMSCTAMLQAPANDASQSENDHLNGHRPPNGRRAADNGASHPRAPGGHAPSATHRPQTQKSGHAGPMHRAHASRGPVQQPSRRQMQHMRALVGSQQHMTQQHESLGRPQASYGNSNGHMQPRAPASMSNQRLPFPQPQMLRPFYGQPMPFQPPQLPQMHQMPRPPQVSRPFPDQPMSFQQRPAMHRSGAPPDSSQRNPHTHYARPSMRGSNRRQVTPEPPQSSAQDARAAGSGQHLARQPSYDSSVVCLEPSEPPLASLSIDDHRDGSTAQSASSANRRLPHQQCMRQAGPPQRSMRGRPQDGQQAPVLAQGTEKHLARLRENSSQSAASQAPSQKPALPAKRKGQAQAAAPHKQDQPAGAAGQDSAVDSQMSEPSAGRIDEHGTCVICAEQRQACSSHELLPCDNYCLPEVNVAVP